MSKATSQIVSSLQDTDATFHTCMPVTSLHEPGFVFMFQTGLGTIAAFGKDDSLHAQVVSQLFIRCGEETPVATSLVRRLVECFEVCFQAGFPLPLITRIAFQDAVMAHQAAFDLIQPNLVSIFHRTRLLAATNNVGMLFKETDDLFGSGNLFALQDAASGLLDDLLCQRNDILSLVWRGDGLWL